MPDILTRLQSPPLSLLGVMDAKTNQHSHNTVDILKAAIFEELASIDKEMVARAGDITCNRLEMVVTLAGATLKMM